jgi:hypothetical protein
MPRPVAAGWRPDESHGGHYARALQNRPGSPQDGWVPDAVVVGLRTKDSSTPVRDGEPRDAAALERDFLQAYHALLADLRRRAGDVPLLLLSLPLPGNGDRLRPLVRRLAAQGCGTHPDLADHGHMAARVVLALKALDS